MPLRLFLILILAACAPLPDLPDPAAATLPTPQILPLDQLLAAAPPDAPQDNGQSLTARAAALRARAAALRAAQ